MLDSIRKLETPENIDLDIRVAGPLVRGQAFLLDSFIRLLIQMLVSLLLIFWGNAGIGLLLIITFALEWFYPVLFEVLRHGQTPGKRVMQIAVVNDDNTPVGWSASIVRNFLRIVDFLPMNHVAGLVCMTLNRDFKRIGDLAAGTLVVYRTRPLPPPPLPDARPWLPAFALTIQEQRAILGFAERHDSLSPERQQELANHLAPLLQQQDTGADAVTQLLRLANGLRGGR